MKKTLRISKNEVNSAKQNKIKYIVRDFEELGIPEEKTREILLKRGINKWLYNRMLIINLKDKLRKDINCCLAIMRIIKGSIGYREMVGRLKETIRIRQRIRKICHNSRWVFPN